MRIDIKYQPSFALATATLDAGEGILVEGGAMVSKSDGLHMDTSAHGGITKSLTRSLFGGESLFLNTFTADKQGGTVSVAPILPGDIFTLELEKDIFVQSGGYLASSQSVEIDTKWGGAKGFFSGTGLILLGMSGKGTLILSSYGAMEEKNLKEGEKYVIDTGHIVAFDQDIDYKVTKVGGWKSTFLSGEFLVAEFTGPGKVIMQTRSSAALVSWLYSKLPKNYNSSS